MPDFNCPACGAPKFKSWAKPEDEKAVMTAETTCEKCGRTIYQHWPPMKLDRVPPLPVRMWVQTAGPACDPAAPVRQLKEGA